MAERPFSCPVPRIECVPETMKPATQRLQTVALRWRNLAERRREHFFELCRTGRWRHYYRSDEQFIAAMHEAIGLADRWAAIAPWPNASEIEAAPADPAWEQASVLPVPAAAA
jgi:hypothetical protein